MKQRPHLKAEYDRLRREIEAIRKTGEVAPEGINIVPYKVREYEYYKLVAKDSIFIGKNGKKTKTQHLGDIDSLNYHKARMAINRRNAIKRLEDQRHRIKLLMSEYLPTATDFKI